MIYDGFCGNTNEELDKLVKEASAAGIKVIDRRRWWHRLRYMFRKKQKPVSDIWWNVKTQKPEVRRSCTGG